MRSRKRFLHGKSINRRVRVCTHEISREKQCERASMHPAMLGRRFNCRPNIGVCT
jgi:hypothetical protein